MPTVTGTVEVTYERSAGPPPTISVTRVRVVGGRSGDGVLDMAPPPTEWLDYFREREGKKVTVDYAIGPPIVVNSAKNTV